TVEESEGRVDVALGLVERSMRLEPKNAGYSLQYYLLRARAGDSNPAVRKDARLFYHLAEGERLAREGKVEEALIQFLEASRENPKSAIPYVKRGDLFYLIKKDVLNARQAYKKAAEAAPRSVDVWARYIELLIQSFEWDEAMKALEKFKRLPVQQGVVDKVLGDWYSRQGKHLDAQVHYRKAMSRSYIDPSVYLAYGNSLILSKSYKLAPFVFSLAMRVDPENHEAILGTAEAIAGNDGLDSAVTYLRGELQKGRGTRVELLCGIASLLIRKGKLDQAEELVEQAKSLRNEAALPWKLTADIALARGSEKKWRESADAAYQAYLSRNASDANIMYQRYRVLLDLGLYEKADMVLGQIYLAYPKYPSIHFSKGQIYVRLGNYKEAIREFEQELKNGNVSTANLVELGKAFLQINEPERALGHFVQAIKENPNASEPKLQAGQANFVLMRYEAAVAMYQEALRLDGGNPLIYRHLGYVYRAIGDSGSMRWAFEKYLEMEPDAADKAEIQRNL
ncbi:MAG: tetratricopeptide repeat protein, partial [Bdellovibrionales bacterium]|nr:tetratricopeptide repeat protein [Bdellovibrionales bacterium]